MKFFILSIAIALMFLPLNAQNYCLDFDGVDDYVQTTLDAQPTAMPITTWEAWFKPNRFSHPDHQGILSTDDGGWDRGIWIKPDTDEIVIGCGTYWNSGVTLDSNKWHHIAVVYKIDNVFFYLNGVEYIYGAAPSGQSTVFDFMIGTSSQDDIHTFEGEIDEVRVWDIARTEQEIIDNMYDSLTGSESGLVGYWRFDEGSDSIAYDSAGSNDATLVNMEEADWIVSTCLNPYITHLSPTDNSNNVPLSKDLVITFNEDIIAGAGNITIYHYSNDSIVETISATSTVITDLVVTIDPILDFEVGGDHYVLVDSTAFMDTDSIYFEGIYNKTEWNFNSFEKFTDIEAGLEGVYYGSVAWGDYDNDGDLDIILTGRDSSESEISKIYNNDSGIFTDIGAGLIGAGEGSVVWGDYDNDGDLDILLTGIAFSRIYNNDSGSFTDIGAGLPSSVHGSDAWGDYDNDGDLDILLTGNGYSKIYRNDSGVFTDIGAGLPSSVLGSAAWGDYDNDGDLDILLTFSGTFSRIYNNDSGVFTDIEAGLEGVYYSSVAWGDYDNDGLGNLDILLTGYSGQSPLPTSKIYRNVGDFWYQPTDLPGVFKSSVAWGDYDNDGDLDILLTGDTQSSEKISRIYRNDSMFSCVFTNINAGLPGVYYSSVAWGDYDNDGDLDILLSGDTGEGYISKIYRNNILISNSKPIPPANLLSVIDSTEVTISWDKSTDNETVQDGLSYNLYIGTIDQKDSVQSSMSDIGTGYRKVACLGNTNTNNSWTIKDLEGGTYYWSVQAVDNAFAGSEFSAEQMFFFLGQPRNLVTNIAGANLELTWDAVTGATGYKVYSSDDPYGTFAEDTGGVLVGETWTIAYSESKKFYYVIAVSGAKMPVTKKVVETPIHRISK